MSHILPLELICHIFSFLQYHDLYLTRGVSKLWRSMVEEHIYLALKTQQQSVTITIGLSPFTSALELYIDGYDPHERVVTFKPKQGNTVAKRMETTTTTTATATTATAWNSWQLYHHRQMQIKLNPPLTNPNFDLPSSSSSSSSSSSWLQALNPQEKEQALFHLQYNPVMECSYALPAYSWLTSSGQADQHYLGDKTLILSFAYIQPPFPLGESAGTSDHQHLLSTLYTIPPQSTTSLHAPQIKIHWLRVTLDWMISFTQPKMHSTQIYANRYAQLHQTLANQYGCYKYDDLSEPVLAYIIHQDENQQSPSAKSATALSENQSATWMLQDDDVDGMASPLKVDTAPSTPINSALPKQLLSYVQEHTHEYQTRLSRLEHMLVGACVNPRMLWKYPFAKSFVVGNGSLLCEEDVVRRIQDSEDEWRSLSRRLKRRLGGIPI